MYYTSCLHTGREQQNNHQPRRRLKQTRVWWSGSTFASCPTRVSLSSQVLISSKPAFLSTRIPKRAPKVGVIVQGFNLTVEAVPRRPSLTKPRGTEPLSYHSHHPPAKTTGIICLKSTYLINMT